MLPTDEELAVTTAIVGVGSELVKAKQGPELARDVVPRLLGECVIPKTVDTESLNLLSIFLRTLTRGLQDRYAWLYGMGCWA